MAKQIKNNKKKSNPGEAIILPNSDTLKINCNGCHQFPDAGSPVCMNCICSAIFTNGTVERIKLSAGKDTEITGPAAEILCNLAQMTKPVSIVPNGRRCSRCPRSPENIINQIWAEFPDPSFSAAYTRLYIDGRETAECAACMQRTYAMLKSSEGEMQKIKDKTENLSKNKGLMI